MAMAPNDGYGRQSFYDWDAAGHRWDLRGPLPSRSSVRSQGWHHYSHGSRGGVLK
jgi:hypothetical protein